MEGQVEPKWRLEASLEGQVESKTLQEAPKRLQVGLQRRPREVQELQNSSPSAIGQQTAPPCKKVFLRKIDDFAGPERSGRAAAGQVGAHVGCAEPNLELRRPSWSPWRAV